MSPSRFRLRKVFRRPVLGVAKPFIDHNVHPNTVTYITLLFAFLAVLSLLLAQNQFLFGILIFLVGFFDGVDGAVARGTNTASKQGAFTDSVIDKLSEALIILAIPLSYPVTYLLGLSLDTWAFLCIVGWLLTSYSRSRAESLGVTDLDVGIGARSERLFTLFVFSVIFLAQIGLLLVTLMGLGTATYRFLHYRHQLIQERI